MTLRLVELRLTIAPKMEQTTPTETLSVKSADPPEYDRSLCSHCR